jgi:hypothetical protein
MLLSRLMPSVLVYASRLRFPTLAAATALLFVFDLLLPDPMPLVDELLIGMLALMFANWKKTSQDARPGASSKDPPKDQR